MTTTTASQVAMMARNGPDFTTATKPMALSDSSSTSKAVFEVDRMTRAIDTTARPNQSLRRSGTMIPAASRKMVVWTMTWPRPFFSSQRPRQAPGKISCIRPKSGSNAPSRKEMTARAPSVPATISVKVRQLHREARATPPRVVNSRAGIRRAVRSGMIDQK